MAIEGAIMRSQHVFEERNGRYVALELAPQLAAQVGFVVRQTAGQRCKVRPRRGLLPKPHELKISCRSKSPVASALNSDSPVRLLFPYEIHLKQGRRHAEF